MKGAVLKDYEWQKRFRPHYEELALLVVRVEVASWIDDAKFNTDLQIGILENRKRIMCRARRHKYQDRYRNDITIRSHRPSGTTTELEKIRGGFGDFFIYGIQATTDAYHLHPWSLTNVWLIREYLDEGGRWIEQTNWDKTRLAAFNLTELPTGTVLNSEGVDRPHPSTLKCEICEKRPVWTRTTHSCCEWHGPKCEACRRIGSDEPLPVRMARVTTVRRSRRAPHARAPNRLETVGAYNTWTATCSCGWVGPPRTRQSETAGDYRGHRDRR